MSGGDGSARPRPPGISGHGGGRGHPATSREANGQAALRPAWTGHLLTPCLENRTGGGSSGTPSADWLWARISRQCRGAFGVLITTLGIPAHAATDAPPAVEWSGTQRLLLEDHRLRDSSPFSAGLPLTGFGHDRARAELELKARAGAFRFSGVARHAAEDGSKPVTGGDVNEAYLDLGSGADRFTIGRKLLSGDVGYAFRPIDVLQRETRLRVLAPPLKGVDALAWERFTESGALSVLWSNPGQGRQDTARHDEAVALKLYRRNGETDWHGVLRASERYGAELGAAFSTVPKESLEVHGSALVQRRGERLAPLADGAPPSALLDPALALTSRTVSAPGKALAGFTWTVEGGWSLLGEAWWDATAPGRDDWRRLASQAKTRRTLAALPGVPALAVAGATAAATRLFAVDNMHRRATLLRLSWTDPSGSPWSAALDWLRSAEDRGWSATASVIWQGERWRWEAGLRRYGGPADSAFGLLPERSVAYAGAGWSF